MNVTYNLKSGGVLTIPAEDVRGLQAELNDLLPPAPTYPVATSNPPAIYRTMTPNAPASLDQSQSPLVPPMEPTDDPPTQAGS